MMKTSMRTAHRALGLGLALLAAPLGAQSVAERAAKIENGVLHMSYAGRPGVCGNGSTFIRTGEGGRRGFFGENTISWSDSKEWEDDACEPGPVRVSVLIDDRRAQRVRVYVGGHWRPGGDSVTDLGTVPAREAADYLLSLTEQSGAQGRATVKAGSEAILAALLADSVVAWPRLMKVARDSQRPHEARRQAVFWLSQAAGDAATAGLDSLVGEAALDRDVREQAVFALSQRPKEEGVPVLIRIARTNKDPQIRRKALFWLGQSDDPRALALFEELLQKH